MPSLRHRRGDIWMVNADPGNPAVGTEIWSNRPAIIVSNNVMNSSAGFALIVYLSTATRKRSGPTHVEIPVDDGNGHTMALVEQVHTVDASRLLRHMGSVPATHMREIDAALTLSMSIGRNPDTHNAFRKWEEHIKLHGINIAKEIDALAGNTVDQRIQALSKALELTAIAADAWRDLYENSQAHPSAMHDVAQALHGSPFKA
ncbi:type II toxin-antitoxin system PemK/MazF family toxin [Plantibacter flavus]|uniref:type II toxin-antitoxin system PemK/MazF family toxin n=1 Tax=Plantibacter flavus TaxID=150123 RepID=UPI00135664F0|nr:type II toxin-antitoxin system PemK/MazF family toxin [Plantibacter flavus]